MRAGLILAVVLLLAACTGAPSDSATPEPTPGETVRVLASGLSGGDFANAFGVDAATDEDEYQALLARLQPQPQDAAVDFEREIVLYLGIAGSSSCPEQFLGLAVDEMAHVYGQWAPPDTTRPCTDDLAPQGVLLAVARSELPSEPFRFSLRQQPVCPDCPDFGDQITVDPR